jgi:HD-GYP domain-containing protein (c-di-GMP phosphodiesterase class II)
MVKKEIPIDALRLGMYVVELDRPWLGTKFAFQGFPVTSTDEIDSLRTSCKTVFVDPERESWSQGKSQGAPLVRGSAVYAHARPLERELPVAKQIYATCEASFRQILDKLRVDGQIEMKLLNAAVASMTESIERNPDAMLLLNRLHDKDSYELTRAMDTSILMATFGRFLQFPTDRLEVLGLAGMLLDVGREPVSEEDAVQRPMYVREPDEKIKAHVAKSVELIRAAPGLRKGVDEVVIQHHERQDGQGYPCGLTGEQISIDGAVAALVDSYAELTSVRAHAGQLSPSNALNTLHKMRGSLFHEALVEQFIQCIGIYPVGSAVELNTGEIGLVIAQNLVRRLQPRVMVVLDKQRNLLRPHKILDLVKEPKASVDEVYRIRRTLPKDALPIDLKDFFI